ncbi:hypothetical protein D1872_37700 [compost metagenome]
MGAAEMTLAEIASAKRKTKQSLLEWTREVIIETNAGTYPTHVTFTITRQQGLSEFAGELSEEIKLSHRLVTLPNGDTIPDIIRGIATTAYTNNKEELENQWKYAMSQLRGINDVAFVNVG